MAETKKPARPRIAARNAAVKGLRQKTVKHKAVKAGSSQVAAQMRREMFVEAYMANGYNGTQAAISAGFSEKSAAQQGSELLKHPKVSEAIARRKAELAQKFKLTPEAIHRSVAQRLYFDPRKLFHPDGRPKQLSELDDDTAMGMAGMETQEMVINGSKRHVLISARWHDKNAAGTEAARLLHLHKEEKADDNPLRGASIELIKALVTLLEAGHG